MNLQRANWSISRPRRTFQNSKRDFIAAAKSYGERKGISPSAWRALGVPADVLRKGDITTRGA
jgi:hypothetical protein